MTVIDFFFLFWPSICLWGHIMMNLKLIFRPSISCLAGTFGVLTPTLRTPALAALLENILKPLDNSPAAEVRFFFFNCVNFSTTTSWASSATCRWRRRARRIPCRRTTRRRRSDPAATSSSTFTTWTTTRLSWTFCSLRKKRNYCWTNRPMGTLGKFTVLEAFILKGNGSVD